MARSNRVEPDRSVTCALCGELADERNTIPLEVERVYEAGPESFETIGRVYVARKLVGGGEAHESCLFHMDSVLDDEHAT